PPRLAQRFRPRPRGGGARPDQSVAGAGGDPRAAGGRTRVIPVRPGGGRRRRLSFCTGLLGVLTAYWLRAERDDRMRSMSAFAPLLGDKRTSNAPRPAPSIYAYTS